MGRTRLLGTLLEFPKVLVTVVIGVDGENHARGAMIDLATIAKDRLHLKTCQPPMMISVKEEVRTSLTSRVNVG